MLEQLKVHGFSTLYNTFATFEPLTIMIGKNGVGKTTLLNVVQVIGKFARGGGERAFGPPPWSLGWQRTKGVGQISSVDFELQIKLADSKRYRYVLKLNEKNETIVVMEESLTRVPDNVIVATYRWGKMPESGTILRPDEGEDKNSEIDAVSEALQSFNSFELNPTQIERGVDFKQDYVRRDGLGVASYLAFLKDKHNSLFNKLETCLKQLRPETEAIELWSPAEDVFWGIKDKSQQYRFPAVHLSWGDRQLVGLLCVLFSAPEGGTIAIEEIDRGFHPSRYNQVIELLKEAVFKGLVSGKRTQVIVTTHSPSFVNQLTDLIPNVRLVTRQARGGTVVKPLQDALREKLGTDVLEAPPGEVWESGLLDDLMEM